jgi:hypothetical protein
MMRLCRDASNYSDVILSASEGSASPTAREKRILRLRLRMTFRHRLDARGKKEAGCFGEEPMIPSNKQAAVD